MKRTVFSKISAVLLGVTMLICSIPSVSATDNFCNHVTQKELVETDTGFTIAQVCRLCGESVSDIGYVKNDSPITLYKDKERTSAYGANEFLTGFTNVSGLELYTPAGVLISTGTPYWLSFDLKVNSLPTLADGHAQANLDDTNTRAYKGCSLICSVPGGSYLSSLRLIYDGWEAESSAEGTHGATPDGKAPVKLSANDNGFRNAETVVELSVGDKLHFDIRFAPATGAYDVYIDGIYSASGKMGTSTNDSKSHIRLWEADGKNHGGNFDFSGIDIFYDNYTQAIHNHSYSEVIAFDDEGVMKYQACDCGSRIALDCDRISAIVSDNLAHIYDGFGEFNVKSDSYWFVTDMNINGEIGNGSLVKFGDTVILEANDGKLLSADKAVGIVRYPTTCQIAAQIEGGSYTLYIDGKSVASGNIADASKIICGSESFGHHVRFLYNKAVTLGETNIPVAPAYDEGDGVKPCYHSDKGTKASEKLLAHTDNGVKYIYNCTLCGERVYSMLKKDLTNPANDIAYRYKSGAIMRAELESFNADKPRYLYVEDNVISNSASPYWLTFDITPNTIPSNATGNLGDPNSRVYKGYSLVSTEPAFLPLSELRVIPDGWEEGNAIGTKKGVTDGKAEVKIVKISEESHIGMDSLGYRFTETVAYLEAGKTTSFALRIDPKTGVYDVYVDGIYKASSVKESYTDMTPKISFHDNGAGEFTYSNISLCQEAYVFGNKTIAVEANVAFTADETSSPNAYTALLAIEQNGEKYNIFYANNQNGTLEFKDKNGNFNTLYDDKDNVVYLDGAKSVAAVYDDINGDVRYYVGGKLAKYNNGEKLVWANEIDVYDADFVNSDNEYYSLRFDASNVTNLNIIGLGASDTAEVVGFQPNDLDDSIRLLSGLDSLYYGAVGYEVQAYKASGEAYKDISATKMSDVIYSSVVADEIKLPASKYGYNYFSALKISGNFLGHKDSYVVVKPFTKIGDKTYYGEAVRLNILDNGRYEFADEQ